MDFLLNSQETSCFKVSILIWMTLQNSIHTIILRYCRSREVVEMFLPSVAVFFMEIVKLVICFFVVCFEQGGVQSGIRSIYEQVVLHVWDTLKVCVPSFLYTLQNNLFYLAASHLEAATFMIMSQLKILTTALFAVCMLKKSLTFVQWVSLALLFVGVSLVQFRESDSSSSDQNQHERPITNNESASRFDSRNVVQSPLIGLTAIVASCSLSGFAGVYFEKILKKPVDVSVWMRNVQLAMMAVPISGLTMWIKDHTFISTHYFLYGFDAFVWFVVFWYGIGGLTVAVCIKYADNIAKNFATSFAIVISTVLSMYIFHFSPDFLFLLGAAAVIASIFLYSTAPQKTTSSTFDKTTNKWVLQHSSSSPTKVRLTNVA